MKKHRRTKRSNKGKAPALVDMTPWKCDDPHKDDMIKPLKTKTMKKMNQTLKIGIYLLVFGTGPLLIAAGLDALGIIDGGNFLLFGMLAWLSFYPGLIMLVAGIVATGVNKIRKK